jgi:predicted tellurium resistance membrane protein TerC
MDLFTLDNIAALLTLTSLEIVLGIDNIVFIAIVAGKLPKDQREKARVIGLSLAIITRLLLLFSLSWMASLTAPWFEVFGHGVSGRDAILLVGGLFLIWKATKEIHHKTLNPEEGEVAPKDARVKGTFASVILQILIIDMVFSLDSVITAVGMSNNLWIMGSAVVSAVVVMLLFSGMIVRFIDRHPTVKMLALSFLLLVGFVLVAEGWGAHIEKGYIYFAMAFSLFTEALNLRMKKNIGKDGAPRSDQKARSQQGKSA